MNFLTQMFLMPRRQEAKTKFKFLLPNSDHNPGIFGDSGIVCTHFIPTRYIKTFACLLYLFLSCITYTVAHAHDNQPFMVPAVPVCLPAEEVCLPPEAYSAAAQIRPFPPTSAGLPQIIPEIVTEPVNPLRNVPCTNGQAGDYPCAHVDLLAFMPSVELSLTNGIGNDIWGWTDEQSGREFALVGQATGTAFVEVTTPTAPRYLGRLPSHTQSTHWRGVKTYKNYAYIVSDLNPGHGLQIFDLNQLSAISPTVSASLPLTSGLVFTETAHFAGFGSAHNIAINQESGFAYVVGGDACGAGGLYMLDLRVPTQPTFAGCYAGDGYVHDTECLIYHGPHAAYVGHELCFNANVSHLSIVDVSDKAHPVRIARWASRQNAYIHQVWLTEDQRYFLMDDEFDERTFGHNARTYLFDIHELTSPQLLNSYTSTAHTIDHNLFIRDGYAYQANYTAGLRVLDLQAIASGVLTEVAHLDTYPSTDDLNFTGAWGAYPYFPSGTIVLNTIDRGLFVLKTQLPPEVLVQESATLLTLCQPAAQATASVTTTVSLLARNGFSGTVTLAAPTAPASITLSGATTVFTGTFAERQQLPITITHTTPLLAGQVITLEVVAQKIDAQSQPTVLDRANIRLELDALPPVTPTIAVTTITLVAHTKPSTFTWQINQPTTGFRFELAAEATFTQPLQSVEVTANSYTLSPSLEADHTYYWRVRAQNSCGSGPFTAPQAVHTASVLYLPVIQQNP